MNSYDNLFLPIDNMESAKAFYGGVLGLQLKFDFSNIGMTAFSVGSEEPAIILKDSLTATVIQRFLTACHGAPEFPA